MYPLFIKIQWALTSKTKNFEYDPLHKVKIPNTLTNKTNLSRYLHKFSSSVQFKRMGSKPTSHPPINKQNLFDWQVFCIYNLLNRSLTINSSLFKCHQLCLCMGKGWRGWTPSLRIQCWSAKRSEGLWNHLGLLGHQTAAPQSRCISLRSCSNQLAGDRLRAGGALNVRSFSGPWLSQSEEFSCGSGLGCKVTVIQNGIKFIQVM